MVGYSTTDLFREEELQLYAAATTAIAKLQDLERFATQHIRCHELARAVAALPHPDVLTLVVQDGHYGIVDHSWITVMHPRRSTYDVLDVYCVGRLPMVQLITLDIGPMHGALYRSGPPRTDIDFILASAIRDELLKTWPSFGHCDADGAYSD